MAQRRNRARFGNLSILHMRSRFHCDSFIRRAPFGCWCTMKDVPSGSRCWVEVSLSQIAANYRNVRAAVGPGVEAAGVVKADAYGHGMIEIARVLAAEGAKWLAVSSVEE